MLQFIQNVGMMVLLCVCVCVFVGGGGCLQVTIVNFNDNNIHLCNCLIIRKDLYLRTTTGISFLSLFHFFNQLLKIARLSDYHGRSVKIVV